MGWLIEEGNIHLSLHGLCDDRISKHEPDEPDIGLGTRTAKLHTPNPIGSGPCMWYGARNMRVPEPICSPDPDKYKTLAHYDCRRGSLCGNTTPTNFALLPPTLPPTTLSSALATPSNYSTDTGLVENK